MKVPAKVWAVFSIINFILAAGFIALAIKYGDWFGVIAGGFLFWNGLNLLSTKVLK